MEEKKEMKIDKDLAKSLSDFQSEVPIIHEGTKGYGYTYSDLKTVVKTITPILKKHNLGFYQQPDGKNLKTIIFHENGSFIESNIEIPKDVVIKGLNQYQILGSGLTYLRRYALSSMLGLVTDVDTDGGYGVEKLATADSIKDWSGILNHYKVKGFDDKLKSKYDDSVEKILLFMKTLDNG